MAATVANQPLKHEPVDGDDFMPAGWCGGCETCDRYPVVVICLRCSYDPVSPTSDHDRDHPAPIAWPCQYVGCLT